MTITITNLNDLKIQKIDSIEDVKILADWFVNKKINFHPEDDFTDYINTYDGKETFSIQVGTKLNNLWLQAFNNCKQSDVWSVALRKHKQLLGGK
jgi:hypothetical protein